MCRQPFAHLLGLEGLALLRGWAGDEDFGESFVREGWERRARCSTILSWRHTRECLIERAATETAYAQWARAYDIEDNGLFDLDVPLITDLVTELPKGRAIDAACGTGRLAIQLAALGFQTIGIDSAPAMLERASECTDSAFAAGEPRCPSPPPMLTRWSRVWP
jgi:2-polyprenyl-3-methyl-5-hydroxy-6-metoxy-1,4-benzoquinol methylase